MATLIENVNAVKAAFEDIKAAIEGKGVTVEDGTPVTGYAALIDAIPTAGQAEYLYYRLTITDFRRGTSTEKRTWASIAELRLYNSELISLCPITEGMVYTASSYSSGETPSNAFDNNSSTYWQSDYSGAPSTTNWIKAKFPTPVAIYALGLKSRNYSECDYPAEFVLEGSNDDVEYTELLSVSDGSKWSQAQGKIYEIANVELPDVSAEPIDLYNHGDVVGINTDYPYQILNGSGGWVVSDTLIEHQGGNNGNITFTKPFIRGNYKKIYMDCEVPRGDAGDWNNFRLGVRYFVNGIPGDRGEGPNNAVWVTNYITQTNYDNTSPWYTFSRQIVEFDLTQVNAGEGNLSEVFYIMLFACNCNAKVYSIWIE